MESTKTSVHRKCNHWFSPVFPVASEDGARSPRAQICQCLMSSQPFASWGEELTFAGFLVGTHEVVAEGDERLGAMERQNKKMLGRREFSTALTPPMAFYLKTRW